MRLLYIWVEDYKCFKNAEMNFDATPRYHFDFKTRQLIESEDVYPSLFPLNEEDAIDNISVIVGNNGSGKTSIASLLHFILFYHGNKVNYIFIFENKKEKCLYTNIGKEIKTNLRFSENNFINSFNILYYSPHYNADSHFGTFASNGSVLFKDISTSGLMEEDLEEYKNPKTTIDYHYKYDVDKKAANSILDNERCISFISKLDKLDKKQFILGITPPQKLMFSVDMNQLYKFEAECPENSKLSDMYYSLQQNLNNNSPKELFIDLFLLAMLCNFSTTYLFKDGVGIEKEIIDIFINAIETGINKDKKTTKDKLINIFQELAHPSKPQKIRINTDKAVARLKLIDFLDGLDSKYFQEEYLVFDITDSERISQFYNIYKYIEGTTGFISSRFFPIISSGEKSELLIYSRIMYGLSRLNVNDSNNKTVLIFLDEAEITLHPQLQQHLINNMIIFLNTFYKDTGYKFHIIFATHSPILLSDIPASNVIFLEKKIGSTTTYVKENKKQTFASNIYQLFNDSFFLDTTPIGDFARKIIQSAIDDINECYENPDKTVSKNTKNIVSLIGEPIFRNILEERIKE